MSNNKIFKNNQVNVGIPFLIKSPLTYQAPRINNLNMRFDAEKPGKVNEAEKIDYKAIGEEIVDKAKVEADLIVKEALLEAKEIFKNASAEVEQLKTKALEEAKQEGYSNGIEQARQEYESLLAEAEGTKEQAAADYREILDSAEEDAVNTILDITRKVISKELKVKKNILLLVREAFEKCSKDHKAVLKLSEQDFEYVNKNKDELMSMLERSEDIEIKKDMSLKEGGCVIETPFGSIDASAYTKLDKIENDFKAVLAEEMN